MSAGAYTGTDEGRYREVLSRMGGSPTLRAIWREAFGDEYPAEAEPFGFVTLSELRLTANELRIGPGKQFADLGCGRGGPGLWLARETGASLTGVEIVEEAVRHAEARAAAWGLSGRARFLTVSLISTGLHTASFDAVVSIDALWMVLNKPAALREAARILRPGGRLVLTTWEPAAIRHEALARRAGFEVISCAEPAGWRPRQLAVYAAILREQDRLSSEMGASAAAFLASEAREAPPMLAEARRILLVAERSAPRA